VLDDEDDDRDFLLHFFFTGVFPDLATTFEDLVKALDFDFATPLDDDEEEESEDDFAMMKFRLTDSFLSYNI